jgi:predicted nucleic acid-binding Zn ribbon protein
MSDPIRLCGHCGVRPAKYKSPAYCEECRREKNVEIKARRKARIAAGEIPARRDAPCAECGIRPRDSSDPSYCVECNNKLRLARYQKIHPPKEPKPKVVSDKLCAACGENPRNSSHPSYCVECLHEKNEELKARYRSRNKNRKKQRCGHCKKWKPLDEFIPSNRGINGQRCKSCASDYARGELEPVTPHELRDCEHCGEPYLPGLAQTKYCSEACNQAAKADRRRAKLLASRAELICQYCGDLIPVEAVRSKLFCSTECGKKAHRLRRRLNERVRMDVPTTGHLFATICLRDGWVCQICAKPVDKTLKHPDSLSASMDHIIQVAWGGTNDPDNLRLTHLVCNQRRQRKQSA